MPAAEGRGWKYLSLAEILREQRGAAHGAVPVDDQAAVGLGGKERLRAGPDGERIRAAQQHDEDSGEQERGLEFEQEGFHGVRRGGRR